MNRRRCAHDAPRRAGQHGALQEPESPITPGMPGRLKSNTESNTESNTMAQKLNKKLVFVVGSLVLLVVLGGAVTLVLRFKYDAERHIRAGDDAMAAGDFRKAADGYGRAVSKKASNLDYLAKFRSAIEQITPETDNEARERYQQLLGVYAAEARVARDDIARWRTFLGAVREQSEAFDNVQTWKGFADRGDDMLRSVGDEGLPAALARLYRGYAGFRRIDSLNDTERAAVVADLEFAAGNKDLTPLERDLAVGSLARLAVRDRAIASGAGRADRIEATQAALDKAMARAEADAPDGLRTLIARLELALFLGQGKREDAVVSDAAEKLGARALVIGDPTAIIEVAQILARGGGVGGEEAQSMLGAFVAQHPDQWLHRRIFASTLRGSDSKSARRELQAVLDSPRPKTGLLAALYESNRVAASIALFDVAFDETEKATGADKEAAILAMSAARDSIAKSLEGAADQSAVLRADGKLALQKGDVMGAIIKFNEIFKKGSQIDLELYVLAALANTRVQEIGRALELVSSGLALSPNNTALLRLRARLELTSARTGDAVNTLRSILAVYPEDKEAADLLAQALQVQAADPTKATASDGVLELAGQIQALAEAKDFDGARRMLAEARSKGRDNDPRFVRIAAAIEMQSNNLDAARQLVREGIAQSPSDAGLIRLNALLSSDDIVQRVIALSEGALEDPKERVILTYLRLEQTGESVSEQAEREKRLGLATAGQTAQNAEKLQAAAREWRAKAEQADRAHPGLLESDFNRALRSKDYTAAEALAKIADEGGRDRTQGPIFRARALMAQDRMQEAATVLERAIQSGVDASMIYRTLGAALERLGNTEAAVRNYEESYKRRPSDMATVRLLVGALVRSGNPQRGLEVLRQARSLAGFDDEVGNTWLTLEQQLGDRRVAQRMREARYRLAPSDADNAIAFASMLALSAPDREDVIADNGKPVYTENQWNSMDTAQRTTELDRVRDEWRKRSEEIFLQILARDPASVDAANAYSGMLRMLGRLSDAEAVLKSAVDKGGAAAGWRGFMMLGQLQCFLQADDRARQSFAEAIRREDPKTRDATRSVVDLLMAIERYQLAYEYLEPLVAFDPGRNMKMRQSECLLRLNRAVDARAAFDGAGQAGGAREIGEELLDGAISVAVGDQLRLTGDINGAKAAFEKAIAPYQRAKQLGPAIPQPFIQDAMLKRKLFELTGDRTRGEEALAAADRATSIGATFYPACAARSEVLVALGDLNGAIGEIERYLRIVPTAVDARRRMVDLLYSNNALDRAEESLRQAIGYAPGEPAWHYTLGDLLARRGRLDEAAACYARADTLRPDPATFFRQLDALIRSKNYRGAIDACRAHGDLIRNSAVARGYLGAALVAIGEKGDGVSTLRESFAVAKQSFDAGDARMMQDWFGAVRLIFAPGLLNEAEALLKDVSNGDPTPVGWEYLSFLALGNDSAGPAKVIAYLEPLADRDYSKTPEFASVLFDRLGTSYYLSGQCEKSLSTFEKALRYTPNNHAVLNNFAYLCIECLKDAQKAMPAARLAVQLQPTRAEYLDTLALVLVTAKQYQEGLDYADRAAKLGDSAPVQLHRAMALVELGRDSQAREALRRAAELNPDPPTKASIDQLLTRVK